MSVRPVKCKVCGKAVIAETRQGSRVPTIRVPTGVECKQIDGAVTIRCCACGELNIWHGKRINLVDA